MIGEYRYATPEDLKELSNMLLNERLNIRRRLAYTGYEPNLVDNDEYKVTIVGLVNGEVACISKVQAGVFSNFNYIGFFYVFDKFRRKGIGQEFLNYLDKYCYENWNARGVDLFTIDNKPMEALVKKCGFVLSGTYKDKIYDNNKCYDEKRWYKLYAKNIKSC